MNRDKMMPAIISVSILLFTLIAVFIILNWHTKSYELFMVLILTTAAISILQIFFLVFLGKKRNIELLKELKKIVNINSKIRISNKSVYFDYDDVEFQCKLKPEENCERYILRAFLPKPLNFGIIGVPKFATAFPRFSNLNFIGDIVSTDRFIEMEFITLDKELASQVLKNEKILRLIEDVLMECKIKREVVSLNEKAIELYINSLANINAERLSKIAELAKELSKYSDLKGRKKIQLIFLAEALIIIVSIVLAVLFFFELMK